MILSMINGRKNEEGGIEFPIINREKTEVNGNPDLFVQLNMIASRVGEEADAYGFRVLTNLQRLAKASALMDKRIEVEQKDIDRVIKLSTWINLRYNIM